jgi:hypothetical protein
MGRVEVLRRRFAPSHKFNVASTTQRWQHGTGAIDHVVVLVWNIVQTMIKNYNIRLLSNVFEFGIVVIQRSVLGKIEDASIVVTIAVAVLLPMSWIGMRYMNFMDISDTASPKGFRQSWPWNSWEHFEIVRDRVVAVVASFATDAPHNLTLQANKGLSHHGVTGKGESPIVQNQQVDDTTCITWFVRIVVSSRR